MVEHKYYSCSVRTSCIAWGSDSWWTIFTIYNFMLRVFNYNYTDFFKSIVILMSCSISLLWDWDSYFIPHSQNNVLKILCNFFTITKKYKTSFKLLIYKLWSLHWGWLFLCIRYVKGRHQAHFPWHLRVEVVDCQVWRLQKPTPLWWLKSRSHKTNYFK